MSKRLVVVCPRNSEPTRCPIDGGTFPHRVEVLVLRGSPIIQCETHKIALVWAGGMA